MKRADLKWVVLIIALYLLVGIACFSYGGKVKEHAIHHNVDIISEKVTRGLYSADLCIKTVQDCNNTAAVSFTSYKFHTDKDEIQKVLKFIKSNEKVEQALVCDMNGIGYNEKGDTIKMKGTKVFENIQADFGKGGSGAVLVNDDEIFKEKSVVIVNQINFADDVKGYLITNIYIDDLDNRIFPNLQGITSKALVGLDGVIIAGTNTGEIFWDAFGDLIPIDTIKMNISQRKKYIYEYEKNGYVLVVTSDVTVGAAILLIDEKSAGNMIKNDMRAYRYFVINILALISVFFVLLIVFYNLGRVLRKVKANHINNKEMDLDSVSGLYSEEGLKTAIDTYGQASPGNKGVLFGVYVDELSKTAEKNGGKETDKKIREFAEKLSAKYRVTDYVARGKNGEFLVFLRYLSDDKNIRKQTDELQLFIHDARIDSISENRKINISAGRALFPADGKTSDEILASVRKYMELSKGEGKSSIISSASNG